MKIQHAIIMAAGRGTRMMPLTQVIPKPMAPYQGSTLIANGIKRLKPHVPNVHITVGYKGALLAEHVIGCEVSSVFNTSGKGNSWWIYNTLLKYLNEPVVVLTCDNIVELDFELLAQDYYHFNEPACMVVPVKPIQGLDGDYIYHEDYIVTKLERHKPSEIYCSGIQVLNPFRINEITDKSENFNSVWDQLIANNELYCSSLYPKKWFSIDTLEHLNIINNSEVYNKKTHISN